MTACGSLIIVKYHNKIFAGLVATSVGITGLMANLTVLCEREVAQLYFNTGGNKVKSLQAAQECTVLNTNETIYEVQLHTYTAHIELSMIKILIVNRFCVIIIQVVL
jgi:hypothetical protein